MRALPPIPEFVSRLAAGERASLSRAITLVESQRPADRELARTLLSAIAELAPAPSKRIGITGSPGAGKSTLIERFGSSLTSQGKRVAVLAIDPSSNRTGGSILGDKTRMEQLSRDPNAYVRPSPAGTTLGGVARATRETIRLVEAAGYTDILVETVGVGQSEHAVRDLVDLMVLLVLPASGDDLQGIKRGIVELADLILVHKADADRKAAAKHTARDYRNALHVQAARPGLWAPRVITGSSTETEGLAGFGESLHAYFELLRAEGIQEIRRQQDLRYFESGYKDALTDVAMQQVSLQQLIIKLTQLVTQGQLSAEQALLQFTAACTITIKE